MEPVGFRSLFISKSLAFSHIRYPGIPSSHMSLKDRSSLLSPHRTLYCRPEKNGGSMYMRSMELDGICRMTWRLSPEMSLFGWCGSVLPRFTRSMI